MTISELAAQLRMAKQAENEAKAERLRIEGLITEQFAKPESNEGTHNDEDFSITWKLNRTVDTDRLAGVLLPGTLARGAVASGLVSSVLWPTSMRVMQA